MPKKSSLIGRFLRTFVISFVLTVAILMLFGAVPDAAYDIPHRFYVEFLNRFSFDESAIVAALPQGRTLSTTTSVSGIAANSVDYGNDTGVDWPDVILEIDSTLPVSLSIPEVGIRVPIVNPEKTDIKTLDTALINGVVHYPGSGLPGEKSNVLFFGHSSNLPVVNNPAYKALNGLEYVKLGDDVFVETKNIIYHYRISAIRLTTAEEELISFRSDRRMITISTCNTFGLKSERFVAEAILVGSNPKTDV